jgi:hypothetical protein
LPVFFILPEKEKKVKRFGARFTGEIRFQNRLFFIENFLKLKKPSVFTVFAAFEL